MFTTKQFIYSFILLLISLPILGAQEGNKKGTSISDEAKIEIQGFGAFQFSLSFEKAKELFRKPPYTFLVLREDELDAFETKKSFLKAYKNKYFHSFNLQFTPREELYLIHIQISREYFNYHDLYGVLKEKYGDPQEVSFRRITWRRGDNILQLGRDHILRYVFLTEVESLGNTEVSPDITTQEPLLGEENPPQETLEEEPIVDEAIAEELLIKDYDELKELY